MNVRSHLRQQHIPTILLHQHLPVNTVPKQKQQNYSASYNSNTSHAVNRPQTSQHKKYETASPHSLSGRAKRQTNTYRVPLKSKGYYQEEEQGLYNYQQGCGEQNNQIRKQEQRHLQFVKSYHQWLKETQVEEYQSSRMINSFALKKTRASLRPKNETHIFQFKVYQPHFNHQYHPPNLFPLRTHHSLKKMQLKNYNYPRNHERPRHKNEGELKLQVMKSIAKRQASTKQQKSCKTNSKLRANNDQNDKNMSLFMKTFSNPKLLSIKNGQLVTGTKIVFIN